ncbi:MAG: spore maturation protein A, partial [Oscillospiraceae bacterium]|nr:spore maturation protein A [Oscillospiraceae bacterium]
IEAVKSLNNDNELKDTANDNMIMLVVLNTASIQLLPTTVAMLRLKYGGQNPMDVLPAILLASFASVILAILSVKIANRFSKRRKQK